MIVFKIISILFIVIRFLSDITAILLCIFQIIDFRNKKTKGKKEDYLQILREYDYIFYTWNTPFGEHNKEIFWFNTFVDFLINKYKFLVDRRYLESDKHKNFTNRSTLLINQKYPNKTLYEVKGYNEKKLKKIFNNIFVIFCKQNPNRNIN